MKRRTKPFNNKTPANFRKSDVNSNDVTAKRVSLSPSFLTLNILSGTARKSSCCSAGNLEKENRNNDMFEKKSSRMKNEAIDIFSEDLNDGGNFSVSPQAKRQCKSIFKEINRKCAEIERQNSLKNLSQNKILPNGNFQMNINPNFTENNNVLRKRQHEPKSYPMEPFWDNANFERSPFRLPMQDRYSTIGINFDFCDRIVDQLLETGIKEQAVALCQEKMYEKMCNLNNILRGKGSNGPKNIYSSTRYDDFDCLKIDSPLNCIPQNEWVFMTPNKNKVTKPKPSKPNIVPGIIYRNCNNEMTDIIELSPHNMTIDLTEHQEPEMTDIFCSKSQANCEPNLHTCCQNIFPINTSRNFVQHLCENLSQQSNSIYKPSLLNPRTSIPAGSLY